MTLLQALCLGIIQGLTEFLPISSSGHLVITQQLFQLKESGSFLLSFDLALHCGTLFAVLVVFYRDIGRIFVGSFHWFRSLCRCGIATTAEQQKKSQPGARWGGLLLLGTIPAAVIGLSLKDFFAGLFTNASAAGAMLLVTGLILWLTRYVRQTDRSFSQIRGWEFFLVGVAQAIAILPGISRSGITIATGLFRRWDSDLAARFSFLLAVPAIAGGVLLEIRSFQVEALESLSLLIVGTVAAAISGFFAIHALLQIVRRGHLSLFAYYCWVAGAVTLIWFR